MVPLVSVLVPTFNGSRYVDACLRSVRAQTFADFEVIVVDDGSSDSTLSIARSHARQDSRIRIFENDTNLGLVGNWVRCIELSRGEWVKFVFQDDLIDCECIEALYVAAKQARCPFVFCRRRYLFSDDTPEHVRQFYLDHARLTENCFPKGGFYPPGTISEMILSSRDTESNFIGEPIAVMFHRQLFEWYGSFNPLLAISCDSEFWQRVGVNVGIVHVPTELSSFRVHGSATTSTHLRDKEFHMNVLDPVVVLHEQAYNSAFEPLRRLAIARNIDLARLFHEKVIWAFNTARAASTNRLDVDPVPLEQWRQVSAFLPRLAQIEADAAVRNRLANRIVSKVRRWLSLQQRSI